MIKKFYMKISLAMLLLSGLWLQAEPITALSNANFWQYRSAFIQWSGIITVALMSIVLVLALRLPLIEKLTNGLDKSYHLHKWLGISSLISAIIHWLCIVGAKYAVGWGLLVRPDRQHITVEPGSLDSILRPLRSSAESLGEWFFYAMLVLGAVSLLHRIGYKFFKLSHKLMAFCFIVIAYHSVVLIDKDYWSSPLIYLLLAIITIGVGAALYSLIGKIGKKRAYNARVSSFTYDNKNHVTDLRLSVDAWQGHKNGQFAYLNFGGKNIHPFTIANTDTKKGELRFLIKELGDFTSELKNTLTTGQQITIEGPYGEFDFNDNRDQIWIAGGIGIAAFKASLQAQQHPVSQKSITLYYCTLKPSDKLIMELQHEAKMANINLKIIDGRSDQRLSVDKLNKAHKYLKKHSIWFCGPVGFSHQLKQELGAIDYDLDLFHQEYFSMR